MNVTNMPNTPYYRPPMNTPQYTPTPPVLTPEQAEKQRLRKDAAFIGIMLLVMTAVMQVAFSALLTGLMYAGILSYEQIVSDAYMGLGNTGFLFVYACVYVFDFLVPAVLVAFCCKRRYFPLSPAKPVVAFDAFLGVLAAMGGCIVANFIAAYAASFMESFGLQRSEPPQLLDHTVLSLLINLLVQAVLPALLEEMVYRGYVLRTLRAYGDWFAVFISAILFGLMHGNILQVPFGLVVGIVLGWLYVMTDNIWLPVAVHFCNNAMATVMEYLTLDMDVASNNVYILTVFFAIAVVGAVAFLLLWIRRSDLLRPLPRRSLLKVSARCKGVFSSVLFSASVIAYIVILFINASSGG